MFYPTVTAVFDAVMSGERVMFVEGKGDLEDTRKLMLKIQRINLYKEHCRNRKVRFLPVQVMRPIYASAGAN